MENLNLAIFQMKSGESPKENLHQILELWDSVSNKSEVNGICLPENSLYNRVVNSTPGLEIDCAEIKALEALSEKENVFINLGAIPLKENHGISNASLIIEPGDKAKIVYRKIHLFDIDMGPVKIRESDQFIAGDKPSMIELLNWNMAFTICYDIRFSEMFLAYSKLATELIFAPAAFTKVTGKAHWQTLIRARAIENQCYLIAPAQTGTVEVSSKKRSSYGHSMAVDPWGKVLCLLEGEEPEVAVVKVSKGLVEKTKNNMPINQHRKL